EQVGRPEMVSVVGEEGAPALARRAPRSSPAVAPDRAIADHDAQLEQLASDPLGTPERVLAGHGRDQFSYLWPEMGASASRTRLPAPEQAPTPPMPADDCIRRHERQVLARTGAESASHDPEQLVPRVKLRPRSGSSRPGQDSELVTQEQVLKH